MLFLFIGSVLLDSLVTSNLVKRCQYSDAAKLTSVQQLNTFVHATMKGAHLELAFGPSSPSNVHIHMNTLGMITQP